MLTELAAQMIGSGPLRGGPERGRHRRQRLRGYWIGREHWGRGVATEALTQFTHQVTARPLYAHVAVHNAGSIRVLEKCAFRRDRVQEATAPAPDDGIEELIFVLDA